MLSHSRISVNAIGVGMHHPASFRVRRPRGSGDFLFLHFLTTYRLRLDSRADVREAGDCIIYSPNTRQEYGGDGVINFGNDWMHMSGEAVRPLLRELNLPLNTLLTPRATAFIPLLLREIRLEMENLNLYWEMAVDLKARSFLVELSRMVNGERIDRLAPRNEELHERLNRLRLVMQDRCAEKWTLDRMARQVHMNRSSFANVYRQLFNSSPINDLIETRLNLAKRYLIDTDKSITEVAYISGFRDVYYFCRQFKKKTGVSPGNFRRGGESAEK